MIFYVQSSNEQGEYTWTIYVTALVIYVTLFYQLYVQHMPILLPAFILLLLVGSYFSIDQLQIREV